MREQAGSRDAAFASKVERMVDLCEEAHEVDGEHPNVTELRNAAAHPGREADFTWPHYVAWLKDFLGRPPREALRLLIEMRAALTAK